jgi:hypothetical protein
MTCDMTFARQFVLTLCFIEDFSLYQKIERNESYKLPQDQNFTVGIQ